MRRVAIVVLALAAIAVVALLMALATSSQTKEEKGLPFPSEKLAIKGYGFIIETQTVVESKCKRWEIQGSNSNLKRCISQDVREFSQYILKLWARTPEQEVSEKPFWQIEEGVYLDQDKAYFRGKAWLTEMKRRLAPQEAKP